MRVLTVVDGYCFLCTCSVGRRDSVLDANMSLPSYGSSATAPTVRAARDLWGQFIEESETVRKGGPPTRAPVCCL